jgi:hypothetical protein
LVPADTYTDSGMFGLEDLEARIASIEVELFFITWTVRYMAFSV